MRSRTIATTALLAIVLLPSIRAASAQEAARDWKPVPGRLMTRWAADVTPQKVHPEYPRPTMVRDRWMNLNGLWSHAVSPIDAAQPTIDSGQILVPFPIESALSGVGHVLEPTEALWYRRIFRVPADWKQDRVLLHFGAVDWHATVLVNGKEIGQHKGGYDPFSLDITTALNSGDNELIIKVADPTDTGGQPRGKQWMKPGGIWYTRTSGIWQTVWLEPVSQAAAITNIRFTPNAAEGWIEITVDVRGIAPREGCRVSILDGEQVVASGLYPEGAPARIAIPNPRAWTPDEPRIYSTVISIIQGKSSLDTVSSYFALRDISVAPDAAGVNRLLLNGKPLFHYGPLDQGFWPDGLYTAPTDEALRFDVEAVKLMGGNMLRKHVKVEPERFYYWCDVLGVMVWQDMPSSFYRGVESKDIAPPLTDEWKHNFEAELREMIADRSRHPSIVMWVPINEGWGQNDLEWSRRMVELTKELDPTRLVNNASGWTDMKVGDVIDIHIYPGPGMADPEPSRASILGEFGGLGLPVPGHVWVEKNNWGYVSYKDPDELTAAYIGLIHKFPPLIAQGLSAAVYTQTTDVEIEVNGWLTYDRELWKIDPDRARAATIKLYAPPPIMKPILPIARAAAAFWRYTTAAPAQDWSKPGFDDSSWSTGKAGFGTEGTPGAVIGTEWSTPDIWLRRTFDLEAADPAAPQLWIHHDEDAEVYINGTLAGSFKGWTTGYTFEAFGPEARSALVRGRNTIAVHCRQSSGGQYIDVGIADLVEARGAISPPASRRD